MVATLAPVHELCTFIEMSTRCKNRRKILHDFNRLERQAKDLMASGKAADAIKIYLFMADGDQSLDAGYLGERLGECYEKIGDLHAAKYWYGRAAEENPDVRLASVDARQRLHDVGIEAFLGDAET
jgi:tetratricopeptide (TPR) repeat protein